MKNNVKALLLYMVKGDPELLKLVVNVYHNMSKGKQLEFLGKARKLKRAMENPSDEQHAVAQEIMSEISMTEEQKRKGLTEFAVDYNKQKDGE